MKKIKHNINYFQKKSLFKWFFFIYKKYGPVLGEIDD